MSSSLPDRPDLNQLRRQAKEIRDAARGGEWAAVQRITRQAPAREPGAVTLALAQFVIARELGFASWPKLKAAVESQAGLAQRAAAFVTASVEGHSRHARRLLEDDPRLARVNIRAAAVVGDVSLVEQLLAADPSVARAVDGERGWQPLLYACYSHWHRIERGRASGMVGAVRLLLDAGASPDTNNGARPHHGYRSALHGSVTVNNPEITRLLLERGANPNDGESLYQAAEHGDHECLRLLLANDATVAGTWALDVAVGADDADGVRLVLNAAARQNPDQASELATGLLARASATASRRLSRLCWRRARTPPNLIPTGYRRYDKPSAPATSRSRLPCDATARPKTPLTSTGSSAPALVATAPEPNGS
jgi:Ankyrin repeats (3 copies)